MCDAVGLSRVMSADASLGRGGRVRIVLSEFHSNINTLLYCPYTVTYVLGDLGDRSFHQFFNDDFWKGFYRINNFIGSLFNF